MNLKRLLAIGAAVCFGLAAVGLDVNINLIALGLLAWVLTLVL